MKRAASGAVAEVARSFAEPHAATRDSRVHSHGGHTPNAFELFNDFEAFENFEDSECKFPVRFVRITGRFLDSKFCTNASTECSLTSILGISL